MCREADTAGGGVLTEFVVLGSLQCGGVLLLVRDRVEQVMAGDACCELAVDTAVQGAPSVSVRSAEDALLGGALRLAAGADERFDGFREDAFFVLLVRNDDVLTRVDREAVFVVFGIRFVSGAEGFHDLVRSGRDEDVFDGIAHRSVVCRRRFLRLRDRRVASPRNEAREVQGGCHGKTGNHHSDHQEDGEDTFHNCVFHFKNLLSIRICAAAIYGLQ